MKISLQNAGKRFNRDWIFRHLTIEFAATGSYAITGANGSGKSTLLQVLAGATMHSEGQLVYQSENGKPVEQPYKSIAIAAPYLELIEELTATELIDFHAGFKNLTAPVSDILASVNLDKAAHKQIRYFSSGMKQRLKLAQAFFSESEVLFLDEPTTNLDSEGTALYQNLVKNHAGNRLLIVSSNVPEEYVFCGEVVRMEDFK
ncbi:MAG: ABC transporter ATP-binding protein [Chitinophagaceae bacterium]|nr:MAG: ABC transporter ATP-binding protein [Chitinophagaceae bacterium]